MRVPLSWVREYVDIPATETPESIGERLVTAGLELEEILRPGADVTGTLVVGHVRSIEELTDFKKPIRWCHVEVGEPHGHPDTPGVRGIICGARNFVEGDLVVVALPGAVLPGGFEIASRETYGHVSDGMICSERELGLGDDHAGIIVLQGSATTRDPSSASATRCSTSRSRPTWGSACRCAASRASSRSSTAAAQSCATPVSSSSSCRRR